MDYVNSATYVLSRHINLATNCTEGGFVKFVELSQSCGLQELFVCLSSSLINRCVVIWMQQESKATMIHKDYSP